MVVEDREGVTASMLERNMALEVHLPQGIGKGMFKPLDRAMRRTRRRVEQAMPAQDRGDRARTRHQTRRRAIKQIAAQLPPTDPRPGALWATPGGRP